MKTAHKDDPTLDPPELTMAELWTLKQDFTKADEWYGKAVAGHGNSAKVHRGFASYSLDRGRIDTAKLHLAAAEKIEPTARETKAIAGLIARYTKDYARATAVFDCDSTVTLEIVGNALPLSTGVTFSIRSCLTLRNDGPSIAVSAMRGLLGARQRISA